MTKEQMQRVIGIGFLLTCLLLGVGFLLSRSTLYRAKDAKTTVGTKLAVAKPLPIVSPKQPVVFNAKKSPAAQQEPHQLFKLDEAPLLLPPETTMVSDKVQAPIKKVAKKPVRRPVRKLVKKPVKHVIKSPSWVLQVASFTDRQAALQFIRRLPGAKSYHIQRAKLGRGYRYRVQAGPFANKKRASDSRATLVKPYRARAIIIRRG